MKKRKQQKIIKKNQIRKGNLMKIASNFKKILQII